MAFKFVLTYDGELQTGSKLDQRRRVREQLAPQLAELWTYRPLADLRKYALDPLGSQSFIQDVGGVSFACAIHNALHLRAELDVLVLSREANHVKAMSRGDVDNRLKSLLDGLRRPQQPQELGGITPPTNGDPFHCLLDDDALVSRVSINTGRLLGPQENPSASRVLITVTVETAAPTYASALLGI